MKQNSQSSSLPWFSLIIPVFNEEDAIERTIHEACLALQDIKGKWEILVVDDGSTDNTAKFLEKLSCGHVRVISHGKNHGNGAAIQTGVRHAMGAWLGTVDADGTYPIASIPLLLEKMYNEHMDMVVGARTKRGVRIPWNRRPAKAVIGLLANFLVGERIPDINSGLRIFTRELFDKFTHLYPDGFSLHMTITLGALTNGYRVLFEPIDYFNRLGPSTMSSGLNGVKHFIGFLGLIVRIVTYFRPLKFFVLPSVFCIVGGVLLTMYTFAVRYDVTETALLLIIVGIQIGFFGLLADVLVRHQQSNKQFVRNTD